MVSYISGLSLQFHTLMMFCLAIVYILAFPVNSAPHDTVNISDQQLLVVVVVVWF